MPDTTTPTSTTESTLSNWVGPYVTDMLGKADALADQPYTAYTGPLTAGTSDLQQQAFSGLAALTVPTTTSTTYDPTSFSVEGTGLQPYQFTSFGDIDTFDGRSYTDPGMQSSYMSPYIEGALMPQMDEARRQAEIDRIANASRMTKAGSFGGSRQAVLESELGDNTRRLLDEIYGGGLQKAFESGRSQFNTEEDRRRNQFNTEMDRRLGQFNREQDFESGRYDTDIDRLMRQFNTEEDRRGAAVEANRQYGLQALNNVLNAGAVQRGIEGEGIAADIGQFENERDYPYRMVQFLQSMLQGMPLQTSSYSTAGPSPFNQWGSAIGGIGDLWQQILDNFGNNSGGDTGSGG